LIFENQLTAGERVPQDEIAADLRVSRVPVREAVIALAGEGWVTSEPHRGAFVNGLDANSTYDHYELLGLLYGFSARRAAQRGSDEDMAKLAEIHKTLLATDDADEFFELNNAFLRQLVLMAGSRRIVALVRVMARSIVPGNYFAEIPGVMAIHKRNMKGVMRALKAREPEGAEEEFVQMLRREADNVVELLSKRGLFSEEPAPPR
jgi:DNA-binding GntR family transcriptional regulator